jgi:micrococcal nuclease
MNRISLVLFLVAFQAFSCNSKSGNRQVHTKENILPDERHYLMVIKVVDGDTFWLDDGSEKGIKIRLIGVDAPESRNVFKKKKGFYGEEAKKYLANMLNGQSARIECDIDSLDRYGRTLAYVYLKDGTFVNADLVKNGYAMVMTVPPNVEYAEEFMKLQQEARDNNRGLWSGNYN